MSLPRYSSELRPDRWRRAIVLFAGVLASAAGTVLIMRLPANTATQGFLMLLWLIASSTELLHFRSAYQRCRGIRLDAEGNLSICGAADRWQPAVLLPASVVLAGQAWLRIRLPDGLEYAEWLTGNPRQSQQWRRFQVIWRHL